MSELSLDPQSYTPDQIRVYKKENESRVRDAARRGDVHINGMPLKVTLELTADCDFFCRMCEFPAPREAARRRGYGLSMPEEDFEKIVAPQVFPYAHVVNLTVVGEPTMVPYLDRVLDVSGQWQTKIEFITHGQNLDRAMIERIGPHAAGVVFSFDGGTRDTFNRIRIGGDFDVVTRNMLLFQRWRGALPEGAYKPYLHMATAIMYENIQELSTIVRIAHLLGVDQLFVSLMIAFNPKMARSSLLSHRALANRALVRAREVADELGVRAVFPVPFSDVAEAELQAVDLQEPDLPGGPLRHLAGALAGGPIPNLEPEPAGPEESFHELGANIPVSYAGDLPAALEPGESEPSAVIPGQEDLNRERAFGSPLQARDDVPDPDSAAPPAQSAEGIGEESIQDLGVGRNAEPEVEGTYTCKFLWNELFIGLQGDVAPCCVQGRPVVGNIHKEDLASIWNGPIMKEMRQRLLQGDPMDCCKDCNYNTEKGRGEYREDTLIIPDRVDRRHEF